jgi:MFS family permease
MIKEIEDGLIYIAHERRLIETILLITIVGIFVYNYSILIPVLTKKTLHQDEKVFGLLMSSLGVGSLLGAMMMSMKSKARVSFKSLMFSSVMLSLLLILIGLAKIYYITMILLAVSGVINIWFSTNSNLILQLKTKDEYRGRVMSVYSLVESGTAPIGYMFSGAAADKLGADNTFLLCGFITIILIALLNFIFKILKS